MIDKHAMIGIPIPVQVEMVCLVNHGHGVGVVVILRIIQPTMAAFAANTIGQTTAVLLRDGAKTIPMCATASCIIARRERRVERTDGRRTYPETTTTTAPTNCGGNGRACYSGNTCNSGFTCKSGTCQVPPLWSPPASDAWITVLIRFFYPDGRPYNGGGLNGASIPVYLGFVLEDSCSWTSTWGDADAPTGSRR